MLKLNYLQLFMMNTHMHESFHVFQMIGMYFANNCFMKMQRTESVIEDLHFLI